MVNITIKDDIASPFFKKRALGTKMALLMILIKDHCYGGIIFTDAKTRKMLREKLDISDVTLLDKLKDLKEDGIIIRDEVRGRYKLNERWIKVTL